jgi:hypothetical protein
MREAVAKLNPARTAALDDPSLGLCFIKSLIWWSLTCRPGTAASPGLEGSFILDPPRPPTKLWESLRQQRGGSGSPVLILIDARRCHHALANSTSRSVVLALQ